MADTAQIFHFSIAVTPVQIATF